MRTKSFNRYEREQACDFTYPVVIDYWTVIVPVELKQDPWPILRPFEWRVWSAIFTVVPFYILIAGLADWFYDGQSRFQSISGFALRSTFMEPTPWNPEERNFNKVFTCTFLLPIFVLGQAYSGILISILTVPNVPTPINSVEELVSQDEMGWAIESGSILEQIGSAAEADSTWGRLYKDSHQVGTCYDVKDEIKEGQYGQLCERMTIEKVLSDDFAETGICNYYVGTQDFLATSFSMAFQVGNSVLGMRSIFQQGS